MSRERLEFIDKKRKVLGGILAAACLSFAVSRVSAESVEYKEITAEKINYNVKSGDIKTSGVTTVIGKTGQKMTLTDAYASKKNAEGKNLVVEWDEQTLMTAKTLRKEDGITFATDATYTACNNCDLVGTAWTVHATDMTHDSENKEMHFYNFWFDMYGVPILYLPYFTQPDPTVKYRSGFLIPEMSSNAYMGSEILIPFYMNFSNYHDMTLTAGLFTDENPILMAEHRLRLDHANFTTTGSFTSTRDNLDRWHIFHDEVMELGDNMRFLAKVQRTSDDTYLQKYEFYEDQPFLESSARLEMFAESGYATVEANVFQDLRQAIAPNETVLPKGDILPRVHGTYQLGLADNLYSRFTGDVLRIWDVGGSSSINRGIAEARIIAPVETAWQKLTFSAAARGDYYQYDNIGDAPAPEAERILSSGYVDWEMPFVKNGAEWTHVIKPKARLTVMGKSDAKDFINMDSTGALLSDASLFVNNRYSGYDMWVNGTYADYGMSWTGYNADGQSAEIFVGQTYDFDTSAEPDINSGYHDGASDIVARVGFNPSDWLAFRNRFRAERDSLDLRHLETDMRVGKDSFFSVGYIWAVQFSKFNDAYARDQDISEGTLGAGLSITKRLQLRGSGVYNFTNRLWQRYNAGIYYVHPCYMVGVLYTVDNAMKVYGGDDSEYDFKGAKSLKFNFSIKMGK